MLRLAIAALAAVALIVPGRAAAAETSPGVSLVASIPERGVISARAVGRRLYVSSVSGVSIYDIRDARAPRLLGRLDLPNGQNEDVDVGSGILLVADDPYGGRGLLHVVNVRDPAKPRLVSSFRTWTSGLRYPLQRPFPRRGIGHTATCIKRCRYAWLAGSAAGIDVIDLRDPARPRLARRFPAGAAAGMDGTHDVQVDRSGLAWVTGGNGTAAYDVSDPVRPRLVKWTEGYAHPGSGWNRNIHHNALRLRRDVVAITEERFGWGCRGAGRLQTWRVSRRRAMTPLDSFSVERDGRAAVACSAHYFDARRGLIAQGFYEQGVRLIDARRPSRLRQVGYYVSRPGLFWGALFAPTDKSGSTVYALDHSRGIDVLALDRSALRPVPGPGVWPPSDADLLADPNFRLDVDSRLDEVVPGQAVELAILVDGGAGPAAVEIALPPELVDVRPPEGFTYDAASGTLRASLPFRVFPAVAATVAPTARPGTQLEVIGQVNGAGDPLPLDDRSVDRMVVVRKASTTSAIAGRSQWRGFCRLPSDYT